MRLICGNVERISETEAQTEKLKAAGFQELDMAGEKAGARKAEKRADPKKASGKKNLEELDLEGLQALAKEKGMEGYASLTAEELRTILKDEAK